MTEDASPSTISTTSSKVAIKELKPDDVLLGRGPGVSKFEGNMRFRELVDERKAEYTATTKRKQKRTIAKEIIDLVHAKGGRFLKQEDAVDYNDDWYEADLETSMEKTKQALREQRLSASMSTGGSSGQGGESHERSTALSSVDTSSPSSASYDATACRIGSILDAPLSREEVLEKGRWEQTIEPVLSQPSWIPSANTPRSVPERNSEPSARSPLSGSLLASAATAAPTLLEPTLPGRETPAANGSIVSPALHPVYAETSVPVPSMPATVHPQVLLFRDAFFDSSLLLEQVFHSQLASSVQDTAEMTVPSDGRGRQEIPQGLLQSVNVAAAASHHHYLVDNAMYSMLRNFAILHTANSHYNPEQKCSTGVEHRQPNDAMEIGIGKESHPATSEGDSAERRLSDRSIDEELSAFLLSSLAVTDRPVITEEQEALERASLTDAEKAEVLSDIFGRMCEHDVPQRKRARIDLDRRSINFLIWQMKVELENIPQDEKQALLEAQMKCRAEEFNDSRLERFLRCEGMNAKVCSVQYLCAVPMSVCKYCSVKIVC